MPTLYPSGVVNGCPNIINLSFKLPAKNLIWGYPNTKGCSLNLLHSNVLVTVNNYFCSITISQNEIFLSHSLASKPIFDLKKIFVSSIKVINVIGTWHTFDAYLAIKSKSSSVVVLIIL